jgi:putative thioredoxin
MFEQGAIEDAMQIFSAILGEDSTYAAAYGGLARCYIALGDLEQAEAVLNSAPAEISNAVEIETAFAQLHLAKQAQNAGPLTELLAALEADENNHQARFDYANALHSAGQVEEAVSQLLELFRRDRDWNDGAAKTQLFTIFDALKPNDPVVLNGRRKLSSMIFL